MAGSFAKIGGTRVILDTSVLDKITADMQPKASEIVKKYGVVIAGQAAQNAPVDTSALRNSIVPQSGMTGDLQYTVSDGVEYGVYQEFGTSRMGAWPFMRPAIEKWTQAFLDAFSELFK